MHFSLCLTYEIPRRLGGGGGIPNAPEERRKINCSMDGMGTKHGNFENYCRRGYRNVPRVLMVISPS